MNRYWIVLGLVLLCIAQVWSKPTDKDNKDYTGELQEDEGDVDESEYVDSDSQNLTGEPVKPITQPLTITVSPGSDITLPCQFLNAGDMAIDWKKGKESNQLLCVDSMSLSETNRVKCMKNNSLVIRNVQLSDSDEYTCTALQEKEEKDNKKIVHRVIVEEIALLPSENNDVDQGTSLTLGCEYKHGIKPKNMIWSRQGQRVNPSRETATGTYIDIRNATRHLAGDYQCLIDTGVGDPIVKYIKLRVKHVPEIEVEQKDYYTGLGVETKITCTVHAHPGVTKLQWFKGDKKVHTDKHIQRSSGIKSHHVLSIQNTTTGDLGAYYCKAWNVLGEAVGPVINVHDVPDQPIFKKGQAIDDAIEFQWRVNSYKPIVESELVYRKEGESEWRRIHDVKVSSSIGKEHIITGKLSGIEAGNHQVKLRVRNDENHQHGDVDSKWGPFSEIKKFDGEYKDDNEAKGLTGSAMRPTVSLMTLLFIILPIAYTCI